MATRRLEFGGRIQRDIGIFDRISWPFLRWIWVFPRDLRPHILAQLAECSCDVVILQSHAEARRFLDSLRPPRVPVDRAEAPGQETSYETSVDTIS